MRKVKSYLVGLALILATSVNSADPLGQYVEKFEQHTEVSSSELRCLARVIYHEARGESTMGKYAVAQVALNRTKHPEFPDSVCAAIKQKSAFPWYHLNQTPYKSEKYREAKKLAHEILTFEAHGIEWGPAKTKNSLFFNTVPFGYKNLKYDGKIGGHLFYSIKRRT